ncbi:PEP-CTERM sorting domain-containing protein [Aquabacterium sp.]|uniref:PEP-CTERM sorting domain-containing protein n=1 Tax=Aquabacterium sp. TaxID=1872578 RepID=UPI003D6CD715
MISVRNIGAALAVICVTTAATNATAAFTQPSYDFGNVSTFATVAVPTSSGTFSKELTFSLSSAADIRIDARLVGSSYKYDGATSYLSNPAFNLFDSNHTLIGTSVLDSTFAQRDGNGCTFTQCFFNQGVTLAQNLAAGSYSIEFSSFVSGTRANQLHFGVSKNEASVISAYLTQVTPAGAVPEASTCAMMLLGLAGLSLGVRKQRV